MPAKKQDVAHEEMAPQAEEMVTPEDASPQTDSENEKPGATRARKAKKATEKSESDTEPENESPGSEGESIPKRKRSYTRPTMNVLSIDERLAVETDADKAKNDLLDLIESMKTKRILTGTIQGVERPEDNPNRSLAVIYHGDFKVPLFSFRQGSWPCSFVKYWPENSRKFNICQEKSGCQRTMPIRRTVL